MSIPKLTPEWILANKPDDVRWDRVHAVQVKKRTEAAMQSGELSKDDGGKIIAACDRKLYGA